MSTINEHKWKPRKPGTYYDEHREACLAAGKRWREKNKQHTKEHAAERYKNKDKDEVRRKRKEYYEKNKERIKARTKEYYALNKDKYKKETKAIPRVKLSKEELTKRRYIRKLEKLGLSLDDYNCMYEEQNRCCAICGKHESEVYNGDRLYVDHNHSTMKARGLLCNHCNTALGLFLDDIEIVKLAVAYLEKYNCA